jgi:hypothetical protein
MDVKGRQNWFILIEIISIFLYNNFELMDYIQALLGH